MQAPRAIIDAVFSQQPLPLLQPPDVQQAAANHLPPSPLLECSMPSNLSYHDLALLIRRILFSKRRLSTESSSEPLAPQVGGNYDHDSPKQLTPELMRKVVSFLVVQSVRHEEVRVVGCSSHDGRHPLASCLSPDEESWWISAPNTMNYGRGREFVDFQLASRTGVSASRLTSISLKIPPLPVGPLSVRQFELLLQVDHGSGSVAVQEDQNNIVVQPVITWKQIPMVSTTLQNVTGWQQFRLQEPIDARVVRLVCLCNQISRFMQPDSVLPTLVSPFDCVGFYAIRFD